MTSDQEYYTNRFTSTCPQRHPAEVSTRSTKKERYGGTQLTFHFSRCIFVWIEGVLTSMKWVIDDNQGTFIKGQEFVVLMRTKGEYWPIISHANLIFWLFFIKTFRSSLTPSVSLIFPLATMRKEYDLRSPPSLNMDFSTQDIYSSSKILMMVQLTWVWPLQIILIFELVHTIDVDILFYNYS